MASRQAGVLQGIHGSSWGQRWQGDRPPACFPQFQFVNSYLSLFYIGFYLKDMERLKEVRPRPEAVPPMAASGGARPGPTGPWALQPLPPSSILLSSLSVCVSSLYLSPLHLYVHLSVGPSTAPDRPVPVPEPRAAALGGAGPARGPAVLPSLPLPPGPPAHGPGQSTGRWRALGASPGWAMWLCWGPHTKPRVHALRGWASADGVQVAEAPGGPGHQLSELLGGAASREAMACPGDWLGAL